ncbi:unnamed protein product, partial [Medioppia subpectinata]
YINILDILLNAEHSYKIQDLWQISSKTETTAQQTAAEELIARIIPKRAHEFQVIINTKLLQTDNKDKFILESVSNNSIRITATSGVSAANGFNYYLKKYLNCHISWSGDQLNIPDGPLPVISAPLTVVIQDKLRYYQNVCTVSYSMVWWDFKRWEREIDWMAMKGINFPLAFNGQEYVWRKVFQTFGLTIPEIDEYFTGPAFLAWYGWSGPLSDNWHKVQAILQSQILARMRSLGMIPVLPAFAGHVPRNITRIWPKAQVSRLSDWGKFNQTFCWCNCISLLNNSTYFLEPEDPHFVQIGSAFISEYTSMYGTDHFYNTDLFNEMTPKTNQTSYLTDCGNAVYQSLIKSDPQSLSKVMQGWLFVNDPGYWHKEQAKALLTSVPKGKLLILDLMSELNPQFSHLDGYYGQPFIWCMLHNFGGVLGMYGAFNHINLDVFEARAKYENMLGIGLTPEGIEQNDIIYDFMTESTWYSAPVDLNQWVTQYVRRRYNYINEDITKAWNLLQNSVFTDGIKVHNHGEYTINKRPSLKSRSVLWYKPSDVFNAYKLFINASTVSQLKNSSTFQYDLVDITRQSLQLAFDVIYAKLVLSYEAKNETELKNLSTVILTLMDDMNDILSTNEYYLLGKWINSARTMAVSDQPINGVIIDKYFTFCLKERLYNEYQAKNQITIWGPNGN